MNDVPDAPWIKNYDRYFDLYYQCQEVAAELHWDDDEPEEEDDEDE